MLTQEAVKAIEEILQHGGNAEVRKRKGEIVIVEIKGKVKYTISSDEG